MFGFFKSKKKQEAAKRMEKVDSFYQNAEEQETSMVDSESEMNDEEYRRRVTEEISKRKSISHGKAAAKPSPPASTAPSPAPTPRPVSQSTNNKAPSPTVQVPPTRVAAAPVAGKSAPVPPVVQKTAAVVAPPATKPVAATPVPVNVISSAPKGNVAANASAKPVAVPLVAPAAVSAARPYSATTPPAQPTASAARPYSATTPPSQPTPAASSRPLSGGPAFTPDPQAIKQLVSMGFSYPAATFALKQTTNHADAAAEFLLEHSESEINRMLAVESAQRANATKKTETPPASALKPMAAPAPTPLPAAPPQAMQVQATAARTAAAPAKDPSPKTTPSASPTPPNTSANSTPKASAPPLPRSPSTNKMRTDNAAVDAAMASIAAKRELLKKQQEKQAAAASQRVPSQKIPPSPTRTKSVSKMGDGIAAPGSPTNKDPAAASVYDKLSSYKTKGTAVREAQEAEDRERKESQERRRKALAAAPSTPNSASTTTSTASAPSIPGGSNGESAPNPPSLSGAAVNDDEVIRPSSAPPKRGASFTGDTFENLFNKKTQSMVLQEQQEAEEKAEKEAQEKKWRKLTSKTEGGGGYTSEGEPEVFDKLYTKKLESQVISEKILQEEKAHLEKVEARISGEAGASLPASDATPLLKKTKSAYMREQLTAEEKQRFVEEERREKELQPAPLPSKDSPTRTGQRERTLSSDKTRLSSDGRPSLGESDDKSTLLSRRGKGKSASAIGVGTADVVTDDDDTEEEDGEGETGPVRMTSTESGLSVSTPRTDPFSNGVSAAARKSSFREVRAGSGDTPRTASVPASPRADPAVACSIPGLVPRTRMNFKLSETSDHRWEGRVCTHGKDSMIMTSVKGSYADKAQCQAVTIAHAPPVYVVQAKNSLCSVCEEAFNKYLKAENCLNCGQLVCPDCSGDSWPQTMVPETFNEKKSPFVRVCTACNQAMERFAAALKSGDMDAAVTLQKSGNVNLHHPFSVLPDSPYPIHCAAGSGNLKLLQWLVEDLRCGIKDTNTGDALTTASGLTVLGVAARQGHMGIMRYAVHSLHCSTTDLTDIAVLQRGLHAALEAPGALPSLTLRKPMLTSSPSFRRFERAPSTDETPIHTDSLLNKAADLAHRLKSPALSRTPSSAAILSGSKVIPAASVPVTPSTPAAVVPAPVPTDEVRTVPVPTTEVRVVPAPAAPAPVPAPGSVVATTDAAASVLASEGGALAPLTVPSSEATDSAGVITASPAPAKRSPSQRSPKIPPLGLASLQTPMPSGSVVRSPSTTSPGKKTKKTGAKTPPRTTEPSGKQSSQPAPAEPAPAVGPETETPPATIQETPSADTEVTTETVLSEPPTPVLDVSEVVLTAPGNVAAEAFPTSTEEAACKGSQKENPGKTSHDAEPVDAAVDGAAAHAVFPAQEQAPELQETASKTEYSSVSSSAVAAESIVEEAQNASPVPSTDEIMSSAVVDGAAVADASSFDNAGNMHEAPVPENLSDAASTPAVSEARESAPDPLPVSPEVDVAVAATAEPSVVQPQAADLAASSAEQPAPAVAPPPKFTPPPPKLTPPSSARSTSPTPRKASDPQSHSFVTGTRRMNSMKMEPPQSVPAGARMAAPGSALSRSSSWKSESGSSKSTK